MQPDPLVEAFRAGDRRALARAITLAESSRADHRRAAMAVLDQVIGDRAGTIRVAISGAPGAGKSSLIERLGRLAIEEGRGVAVLAIDPSSTRSGGSILGDKTRMVELAQEPNAFIRPSPAGATLGGIARRTRDVMLLCEAFGFELVLVETVGVGQSEIAADDIVDTFVLLVPPGAGDELQAIKRGVVEVADIIAVTKADGDLASAARRAASDYDNALRVLRPTDADWKPRVIVTSATTGEGVREVWLAILAHHNVLVGDGRLRARRVHQATASMWAEVTELLLAELRGDTGVAAVVTQLERDVIDGVRSPGSAAQLVVETFLAARQGDHQG